MERAAELSLLARDVLVRCPCRQHVGSAIDSQSAARSANTGNARRGAGGWAGEWAVLTGGLTCPFSLFFFKSRY